MTEVSLQLLANRQTLHITEPYYITDTCYLCSQPDVDIDRVLT